MKWIRGKDLLNPPHRKTPAQIFGAATEGLIVPRIPDQSTDLYFSEPGGHKGTRRLFPSYEFDKAYNTLGGLCYQREWLQRWLSRTDEENQKDDDADRQPGDVIEEISEKRARHEKKLEKIQPQIRELETLLAPTRIWKVIVPSLSPQGQEDLMNRVLEAYYLTEEIEEWKLAPERDFYFNQAVEVGEIEDQIRELETGPCLDVATKQKRIEELRDRLKHIRTKHYVAMEQTANHKDVLHSGAAAKANWISWEELVDLHSRSKVIQEIIGEKLSPSMKAGESVFPIPCPMEFHEYFAVLDRKDPFHRWSQAKREQRLLEIVDGDPGLRDKNDDGGTMPSHPHLVDNWNLSWKYLYAPREEDRDRLIESCLKDAVFSASEVDQVFSQEHSGEHEKTARIEHAINIFPCSEGTTWEQLTFTLKSDDVVYVKTPKGAARIHYGTLGFIDKRKGDSPNTTTWPLFQALAKMNGEITLRGDEYLRHLPDNARRLSKHLKSLFGIKESIWLNHYKKNKSYKARFTIHDERDK